MGGGGGKNDFANEVQSSGSDSDSESEVGGLYKLHPVENPYGFESAWFHPPLNLSSKVKTWLQAFAFKCNLCAATARRPPRC